MPVEIYKVGLIGNGFLAIMARPAVEPGAIDPFATMANIGVQLVVSLLEPSEARSLGLDNERELVKSCGMDYVTFPIPDMGQPVSVEEFAKLAQVLSKQIGAGVNTLVHCRAGIGRSGLVAAGILMQAGANPEQALEQISKYRGVRVPETSAQQDWLAGDFALFLQQQRSATRSE